MILFLYCIFFRVVGQGKIQIEISDTCTYIQFQNIHVDTTLYFVIPSDEQYYALNFQNKRDTQFLHIEKQCFVFRECHGLKVRCTGNCVDKTVTIVLNHDFSKEINCISPAFLPAYRHLFANFKEKDYLPNTQSSMLIMCYTTFTESINDFMESKRQEGIICSLLSVAPNDSVDEIQKKITDFYELYRPDYLLLIGDDEQIPSYRIDETLSDCRYALLKGEDDFPEMIVGRISANTLDALNLQFEKIRKRNSLSFSGKAIGIASDKYSSLTGKYDWEYMRENRNILLNKKFNTVYEYYDGSQGKEDAEGNPSTQEIVNRINQGVSVVNYLGVGSYDEWETGNISVSDLDNLSNTTEFPIVVSAACLNGYFAGRECLAEKWMTASYNGQASGAVAALMFSSLVDWDESISAQKTLNDFLPHIDSVMRFGSIYLQTYIEMLRYWQRAKGALTWIYFGDPSVYAYPNKTQKVSLSPSEQLELYPNPVTDALIIDNAKRIIKEVKIYDVSGKEVKRKMIQDTKTTVNTMNLPKGLYMLKIIFDNQSCCFKKIIKQ